MTTSSGETPVNYLQLAGVWPLRAYCVRRAVAVTVAGCPPIVCAWLAENSGRWDLFERSGSITVAIGLVVASRRYVEHGIFELAMLRANNQLESEIGEVLENIFTTKLDFCIGYRDNGVMNGTV